MNITIITYVSSAKKEPFTAWLDKLDTTSQAVIVTRLHRISLGNMGDCKKIKNGEGIWEFRISYGPGFRIYFGQTSTKIIVLLIGGDKGSQERDIEKAKQYWLDYKGKKYEKKT